MTDGNDLAFEDAEEFGLAQDEQLFPVDLDRAAGVLAEHHLVAHLDTHSTHVAIIKRLAGADSEHFATIHDLVNAEAFRELTEGSRATESAGPDDAGPALPDLPTRR